MVAELLRRRGLRPHRRRGQNFLVDANVLQRVVDAAELDPAEAVFEIGAGLGVLTRALATRCRGVLTVEVDSGLCALLCEETIAGLSHVTLLHADFLDLDLRSELTAALGPGPYPVVANLPYSITTPALTRILEHPDLFRRAVLMVQREVADRLLAAPGTREYGSLTLFVQFHADLRRVCSIPRRAFLPVPDVESTLIRVDLRETSRFPDVDPECYFSLVHAAFGQRRKTLANALAPALPRLDRPAIVALLAAASIDPGRRGETLSPEEFAALARVCKDAG